MMTVFGFILILLFSCSSPTKLPLKKAEIADLYVLVKPNAIELINDYHSIIYYHFSVTKIVDFDQFNIGKKTNFKIESGKGLITPLIAKNGGDLFFLYWWTDDYKIRTDVFIRKLR